MQVQQQFSSFKKHQQPRSFNLITSPTSVTVEQIYDVDTITLEQLIQLYEKQPFYSAIDGLSNITNLQEFKVAPQFSSMSTRQLRKWYQLAKIQLSERKKIQDFAFKLMSDDFQTSQNPFQKDSISFDSFLKVKSPLQKQASIMKQAQTISIQGVIQSKKQVSLKLPPIQDSRTTSQSKLRKISLSKINPFEQEKELHKVQSKNQNSRSNLISQILHSQKSQSFSSICQTSKLLSKASKTIETQITLGLNKKQNKVLSKKQFLEMMKIKLNQGTDYKTKAFIKQPPKSYGNQNSTKIGQIQKDKNKKSHTQSERTKTQSMFIKSKQDTQGEILTIRGKMSHNVSSVSINSLTKINPHNGNERYRNNSTYTSREAANKKMMENTSQTKFTYKKTRSQSIMKSINKVDLCKVQNKLIIEMTQAEPKIDKEQSDNQFVRSGELKMARVKSDQDLIFKAKQEDKNKNSIIFGSNLSKVQIFIENQDAYDDEPEVFMKEIKLTHQQILPHQVQAEKPQIDEDKGTNQINVNNQLNSSQQKTLEISSLKNQSTELSGDKSQEDSFSLINLEKNQEKSKDPSSLFFESTNSIDKVNPGIVTQPKNQHLIKAAISQQLPTIVTKIRPASAKILSKYPSYNLQFPSFSHLFHVKCDSASTNHNKYSLPHSLKSLEDSLEMYFSKNVAKIAQDQINSRMTLLANNERSYMQNDPDDLSQVNIELKCVTQLQFLSTSEGQSIFCIDLSSYKNRSLSLLKKLKSPYLSSHMQSFGSKNHAKNNLKQRQNNYLFYRVVKNKPEVYDIINTSFYRTQNWLQLPHGMDLQGCWNLLWTWSKPQIDFNSLIKFQKVNHFPGSKELARKDLLKKNIQKIKKLSKKLNQVFDIIPETFFLPGQNIPFIKKFRQSQRQGKNLWILKPVGLSRGRGISVINKLQEVVFSQPIVMQKYIHNPFLLQGYKFDLRIYVLVTSINPLQCFIYKEGFARVSTERYCNDLSEIDNKFVHLTNYSIQKDSMQCPGMFTAQQKELGGCKLTLKMLQTRLQQMNIKWSPIWTQIEEVVLKSLISCMKYIPQNPNCFEIFGYDIMLDQNLKCWLIEVNSSPSLEKDFLIDEIVKQQLVDDVIQVVQPIEFDRVQLLKVIKRRRKQFQGLKSHVNYSNNSVEQLNEDLFHILKGKTLRNYGLIKEHVNFKCIAPGPMFQKILKTVQHYTHDPFVKNENFY